MSLTRRQRFEVLRRDNYTCTYCGARSPDVTLHVDHVVPQALGGTDDPTNLTTACVDCNAGKASTSPDGETVAEVDATAMLFSKAMERAAALRREQIDARADRFDEWAQVWSSKVEGHYGQWYDDDFRSSLTTFMDKGLEWEDLFELIGVTFAKRRDDRWKFFCGCCWREISTRQEMARRMLEDGQV